MTIRTVIRLITWACLIAGPAVSAAASDFPPTGVYHTSWIGNSFGGGGGAAGEALGSRSNGFGYWVQDSIGAMAVAPDGTVFLGTGWDEAGRTVGLYKNGLPNRVLVTALDSPAKAWGFNTANAALCVDGGFFYLGGMGKALLKFAWRPGDINSGKYIAQAPLPEIPAALSCARGRILLAYPDKIELRDQTGLHLTATYRARGTTAVLFAPDGSFWVIAAGAVRHLHPDQAGPGAALPGIGNPASLAWSNQGALIVADNGPAQRILFFDVSGAPRLTRVFGVDGGLYAGTPGAVAPQKLFAPRAGMDAAGNLYVGMSFSATPNGNTFLRAFSPAGRLLWEDDAAAFVDTFGFEPGSDGTIVYGRTTRRQLNLDRKTPGAEARLTAITLDPLRYPGDPRLNLGYSVEPRLIHGTRLLYGLGQYSGGFAIFAGAPGTDILHPVARAPGQGWAWYVTEDGDLWNGDAPRGRIALYALKSVTAGAPVYDWEHPRTWDRPRDFQQVTRVIYQKATDRLYVFGYLKARPDQGAWGTIGFTARRYDGWRAGAPVIRWTNTALPASPGAMRGRALPAKDVSLAGNYLFLGMVRDARQFYAPQIAILNASTGKYAGTLKAGPEVGGLGGWEDMAGSVHAVERANGEYLILVEDDFRAKNLLFRWTP